MTDRSRLILIGTTIMALIYVRPGLTLLIPSSLLFLFLFYLQAWTSRQAIWRSASAGAIIAAIVALGLCPWSYTVSKKFGGLFITTTSVDLNIVYAFGSSTWKSRIAPGDNPWGFIFGLMQTKAESTGNTFASVSKGWRNEVIGSLTLQDYAAVVRKNLKDFFLNERDFLERFASPDFKTRGKVRAFDPFNRVIIVLNSVLWRIGLPLFVLALLLPWRLVGPGWWLGLFYRIPFCCIAIQPFLSDSNGRYYVILIPLFAASAGIAPSAIACARQQRHSSISRRNEPVFQCLEWAMPAAIALALTIILVPAL